MTGDPRSFKQNYLVCCCAMAGTDACHRCNRYLEAFGPNPWRGNQPPIDDLREINIDIQRVLDALGRKEKPMGGFENHGYVEWPLTSKKKQILIKFLLDTSASMGSRWTETIQAVENYFHDQANQAGDCDVTFATFDEPGSYREWATKTNVHAFAVPTKMIGPWGGSTALFDSTAQLLAGADSDLLAYDKVLCVIMTDGQNNASREVTGEGIKAQIERLKAKKVDVIYLGVSPDAWKNEGFYGNNAIRVGSTVAAASASVNYLSDMTTCYRAGTYTAGDIPTVAAVDDDGKLKD